MSEMSFYFKIYNDGGYILKAVMNQYLSFRLGQFLNKRVDQLGEPFHLLRQFFFTLCHSGSPRSFKVI